MTRRTVALAALAGFLLALSFPTVDLSPLAWVGLVPLLTSLRGRTIRQGFWLGGITGLVTFSGTIYWVTNSVNVYGHVPLLPASLITLLLCAYCALYPALFGAAITHVGTRHHRLLFLAAPALWTTLDLARTYVFSGFPWAFLGYTQYRYLPVIQIADSTGVYGVTFLIVLVNAAIASFLKDRRDRVPLLAAIAVLAIVPGYGAMRLQEKDSGNTIRIAVVQGNIEQDKKWDPAYQAEVTTTYERLTNSVLPQQPDLILWPETATPFYFGGTGTTDAVLTEELRQFVRAARTPLLTGSPTYEKRERRYILKNSAFLLGRDGATEAVYHKLHLVPFGEYIPLKSSLLFFVEKMVDAIGDFETGRSYTIMQVRGKNGEVGISTVICYEIIFPDLVRRFVKDGARIMTTITNDAWFGRSGAPAQHFAMAVLRAVENRVPVARAANTGISGFIDAQGRILDSSSIFTEAALVRDIVPATGPKTFYTRYGDVFSYLCVVASLVLLAIQWKGGSPLGDREHMD